MCLTIFSKKKSSSRLKIRGFLKCRKRWKIQIFHQNHKLTSLEKPQPFDFSNACFYSLEYRQTHFLGNTGQEKVFYDIVERKNPFLSYKN